MNPIMMFVIAVVILVMIIAVMIKASSKDLIAREEKDMIRRVKFSLTKEEMIELALELNKASVNKKHVDFPVTNDGNSFVVQIKYRGK